VKRRFTHAHDETEQMQEIQLKLTLAEVNQILDALGDKSYKQVYQLIIKIQQQAESQLSKNDLQPTMRRDSAESHMP
jgi:hypothetical protein